MSSDEVPEHVHHSVESVAAIHARGQASLSKHQRWIEWLTAKLGRPASLYGILIAVAMWVALNLVLEGTHRRPLDPPPFYYLQGVAAVGSLLMTTIILTTQNRQTRHAEERQQLDLQVNLLAEAKVAKLIGLIEELRRDLPAVPDRFDPVAEAMQESVDPGQMLAALQRTIDRAAAVVIDPKANVDAADRVPGGADPNTSSSEPATGPFSSD